MQMWVYGDHFHADHQLLIWQSGFWILDEGVVDILFYGAEDEMQGFTYEDKCFYIYICP